MFDKLRDKLGFHPSANEEDVAGDEQLSQSRETGGVDGGTGDAASTTGTGESEEFVGRVSGQDDGAERTSGAEARAFGNADGALTDDEPSGGRPAHNPD
ncbi:MAG TPA: hypothetical protein VGE11_12080 [Pseudonocardia sp.]